MIRNLGHQLQREPHDKQTGRAADQHILGREIYEKICCASVGACLIWKLSDIPKAYCRADRGQFKAGTGPEAGSFPIHGVTPFMFLCSGYQMDYT